MAKLGASITHGSTKRVEANNQVPLSAGTYFGTIADVWIYNVDFEGKYTKEKTSEQKVSLKVQIDGTPYTLDRRMRAYLSPKSHFAKTISALTGIEPGSSEMDDYDSDNLVGKRVTVLISRKDKYANIDSILPAPAMGGTAQPDPGDSAVTPEAVAMILALVKEKGFEPMELVDAVIFVSGASTNELNHCSLNEAREVYARLKRLTPKSKQALSDETPF